MLIGAHGDNTIWMIMKNHRNYSIIIVMLLLKTNKQTNKENGNQTKRFHSDCFCVWIFSIQMARFARTQVVVAKNRFRCSSNHTLESSHSFHYYRFICENKRPQKREKCRQRHFATSHVCSKRLWGISMWTTASFMKSSMNLSLL